MVSIEKEVFFKTLFFFYSRISAKKAVFLKITKNLVKILNCTGKNGVFN
jgi:hypothetical protein